MLFFIPKELHEFIDFSIPGWGVKETATEEQRKEIKEILEKMKKEEEEMVSVKL